MLIGRLKGRKYCESAAVTMDCRAFVALYSSLHHCCQQAAALSGPFVGNFDACFK